jgi:hypothetical protein
MRSAGCANTRPCTTTSQRCTQKPSTSSFCLKTPMNPSRAPETPLTDEEAISTIETVLIDWADMMDDITRNDASRSSSKPMRTLSLRCAAMN